MAWDPIPDVVCEPEAEIRDDAVNGSVFQRIANNITEWQTGGVDAPRIRNDAIPNNELSGGKFQNGSFTQFPWAPGSVGQLAIATNAIRQQEIDTNLQFLDLGATASGRTQRMFVSAAGYAKLGHLSYMYFSPGSLEANDWYRFGFTGIDDPIQVRTGFGQARPSDLTNNEKESYVWIALNSTTYSAFQEKHCLVYIYYVDASPPYNLGDGDIPLFCFMEQEQGGKPLAGSSSSAPPWINNGPTDLTPHTRRNGKAYRFEPRLPHDIKAARRDRNLFRENAQARITALEEKTRIEKTLSDTEQEVKTRIYNRLLSEREGRASLADVSGALLKELEQSFHEIELTPEVKNSDISIIPHPLPDPPADRRIVLLRPSSDRMLADLEYLHKHEQPITRLIHEGLIEIKDDWRSAAAPPGVAAVRCGWRYTP